MSCGLFVHPASPAGNLAPLTWTIAALWIRLDRPVRSPTPSQGPKGSGQGTGMPPPAACGDTVYKRVHGEQSVHWLSVLWQSWLDVYLLSHGPTKYWAFCFRWDHRGSSQPDKSLLTVHDKYMSDRGQLNCFVNGKKSYMARWSKDSEVATTTIWIISEN